MLRSTKHKNWFTKLAPLSQPCIYQINCESVTRLSHASFIRFDLWLAPSDSYIIRYDKAPKSFIRYIGEIRASDWCICTSWYKIPLSDWLRGIWTCIITSRGWRNVRADALIIIIRPSTQTREEKKYVSFAVDWPCQSQYLYKLLFHRQLRARLCRWSQESRCSP